MDGPKYGYFTNANKTWLVTKEDCLSSAVAAFADTDVKVSSKAELTWEQLLVQRSTFRNL